MIPTITQVVSHQYQQARLKVWARIGLVTVMLAFCPALLPVASASCGGIGIGAGTLAVPVIPALSGFPANAEQASASKPATNSIVGLWNIQFSIAGAVVDVAFDAWHSDGTEVLNDYSNPINGNVCLGVWRQTAPGVYKLKHPSWYFDGSGTLLGTVIIREDVTLSSDGNSFSGNAVDDVYDVGGNFLYAITAQVNATRIEAH